MFRNKQEFKKEFSQRLIEAYGTTVDQTHPTEKYLVLGEMVRDYASVNWKDTKVAVSENQAKQVYYFSGVSARQNADKQSEKPRHL